MIFGRFWWIYMCKRQNLLYIQTDGDSSDKPMAMWSQSMARSQCWTTVSNRTRSLSAPDVKQHRQQSTLRLTLTQYTTGLVKRKSWKVRIDPGWDPTAGLSSGLIVAGTVYLWCTKQSGPLWYCCTKPIMGTNVANVDWRVLSIIMYLLLTALMLNWAIQSLW